MFEAYRSLLIASCLLATVSCGDEEGAATKADAGAETDASQLSEAGGGSTLLPEYVLSSSDSVPEGVAFDPQERAFYAGSLNGGSITKVSADGKESIFRPADGSALVGLKVDVKRRRLWACATDAVWAFELLDGTRSHEIPLSAAADGARCNDLVVDEDDGKVYVTDPGLPNIYSVDRADVVSVYATNPAFSAGSLGLNGITFSADGSALLAGLFIRGQLFHIPMANPAEIKEVALTGEAFASPDGLVMLEAALYAVSNNELKKVTFEDASSLKGKVTLQAFAEGGLSTGTAAEGELYAIRSGTFNYVTKQPLSLPFKIVRIDRSKFK